MVIDATTEQVALAFADGTLPKPEWTHEAHLRVCWATLSTRTPGEALPWLRTSIRRYNELTGVANTATSGYHETLTRYFVGAVASLDASTIAEVLDAEVCSTVAPLSFWSRDVLFGERARAEWVPPDQTGLPWGDAITR